MSWQPRLLLTRAFSSFLTSPLTTRAKWNISPASRKFGVGQIARAPATATNTAVIRQSHDEGGRLTLKEHSGAGQMLAESSVGSAARDGLGELKGPIVDLLTPFTREGDVDFKAFGEYLRFLCQSGVPTVLCNGQAGEFESLTTDERKVLVDFARTAFPGTVLNHVSASALPDVTRLISHSSSQSRDGPRTIADAVVLMAPHSSFGGIRTDEGGSEAFLRKTLKGCELPVLLYSSAGNPISPELFFRLCDDFPVVCGIMDGDGSGNIAAEISSRPKKALLARQLLLLAIGDRCPGMVHKGPLSVNAISAMETRADAFITSASSPLPELAVQLQACLDRGDKSGAKQAERELDLWSKKRQAVVATSEISVVKAALAARVPGFPLHTRPPLEDLELDAANEVMRWVSNNEGVRREKQNAHIRKISSQLSEVYRRAWSSVEVAGLELLLETLSASEERLLGYLERAKHQRAELMEQSAVSASLQSEVEAARLLSDVMEARRRLEEDAGQEVSMNLSVPASGLKARLEDAKAIAEKSQGQLMGNLNGFGSSDGSAGGVSEPLGSGGDSFLEDLGVVEVAGLVPAPEGAKVDRFESSLEVLPMVGTDGDITGNVTGHVTGEVNGDGIDEVSDDVIGDASCHAEGVTGNLSGDVIGDASGDASENVSSDVTTEVTTDVVRSDIADLGVNLSPETADRLPNAVTEVNRSFEMTDDNVDECTQDARVEPAAVGIPRASSRSSREQAKPETFVGSGADSSSTFTTTSITTVAQADTATLTPSETTRNPSVSAARVGELAWGTAGPGWSADDALGGINDPGAIGFDGDASTRTDAEWMGEEARGDAREPSKSSSSYHQHQSREFSDSGEGAEVERSDHVEERFGGLEGASSTVYDTLQFRAARGFVEDGSLSEQEKQQQQQANEAIEPVQGDFTKGLRCADRDYDDHPAGNMHSDLQLPENGDLRRLGQQQQALHETPQRGDSRVSPVTSAQETKHEGQAAVGTEEMASSRARVLKSGAPEWGEEIQGSGEAKASFGARELLEKRDAFGGSEGRGTASEPVGSIFGQSESGTQSSKRRRAALPTPRYGRYIPEGLPSKTPKTLPPEFPFQADRLSSELEQSHHHNHHRNSDDNGHVAMGGSGDERWAEFEAGSGVGSDGQEESAWSRQRGSQQWGVGAATADSDRFEGTIRTVDDFREKEKETFFKSKGIDGDVDSFDWDQLRRNTREIEDLQKEAVELFWRRQGVDPDDRYPRRRRR